jgi:hypothetical protein
VVAVTAFAATVVSAAWADDGDSMGVDLRVAVISSSASPTATSTSTSSSTSTSASTSGSTSVPTSTESTDSEPTATPTVSTGTGGSLGGILYVSGIGWNYTPSINPFGGTVDLRFTVRNVFSKPVSASASFWATNIFGSTLGAPIVVPIDKLQPGETRTVSATLGGLAQWTVITAHTTFTPPPKVGDTAMTPVTRDAVVWFAPWLFLLLTSLAGAGVLYRRYRTRRAAGAPPPVAAGEDAA